MLAKFYQLSDAHHDQRSAFRLIMDDADVAPTVGAYNDGVLMVVDEVAAATLLDQWRWLVNRDCFVLMTTGLGDVFFWDPLNGINYLEVQTGSVEVVDSKVEWFLGEFLSNPKVLHGVLKHEKFEELVQLRRSLRYHETFILEPWSMLGGSDSVKNYSIGKCAEYLVLVGQAHDHRAELK